MFCDVSFREELRARVRADMIHAAFARWRCDPCGEDTMDEATQWLCPQEIRLDIDAQDRRGALEAVSALSEARDP